jgi:drug/metabolite transporter (DMT)-like permease
MLELPHGKESTSLQSLAYASLAITLLIWGVAPAVIRSFSLLSGPSDAIVIRSVTVGLFCLFFLPFLKGPRFELADLPRLLITSWPGMFGYFLGTVFGYAHVTSGIGGIITATQPLLIAILAAILGLERLTLATVLGLLISFAGTLLLFSGDQTTSIPRPELMLGAFFVFGSGVAWAIYVVTGRPLLQKYGAFRIAVYSQLLCVLPALAFYSPSTLPAVHTLDTSGWISLIYLTLVGSILTLGTWNYAAAHLRTTIVGASLYVIPLMAIAAGAVLLGEKIQAGNLVAALVILAGVAVAQFGSSMRIGGQVAALAAVIFAVSAWGLVPLITRYLVLNIPPESVMFLRLVPAGFIGLMMTVYVGLEPMSREAWVRVILAAIGGNVTYQVLAAYGAQHIPASWIGLLFGLEPVFIALFAVMFAGERLTIWLSLGIMLALVGTGILMLGSSLVPMKDVSLLGIVMVTLSTLGWGIYTVAIKPVATRYGSMQITGLTLGLSAFPMLIFISPQLVETAIVMTPFQWGVLATVVIVCTILSTLAWNFAVGHMPGSIAGVFLYMQPIIGAVTGVLLLGESITIPLVVGGSLILAGVALAQFGPMLMRRSHAETGLLAKQESLVWQDD